MRRLQRILFTSMQRRAALAIAAMGMVTGYCAAQATADGQGATGDGAQAPGMARPQAAIFQNPIAADQLAFLKEFAGRPAKELTKDKRFHALLKLAIPRTDFHYGRDMPLNDAWDDVLSGSKEPVVEREDRYVLLAGDEGPYLRGKGFLWFDMKDGIALGGFYFHPVNGEPTPTLAIFSRQLTDESLSMSQLPLEFARDESEWVRTSGAKVVSPRYFIPENGRKYVLVHDEDYCDHPENAPPPPENVCEALNLEAAEADLDASSFITEAHNAANATALRMNGILPGGGGYVRVSACRNAANPAACRVRMTRERTQALLAQR